MGAWRFDLCDSSGEPIGELRRSSATRFIEGVSRPSTAVGELRGDSPFFGLLESGLYRVKVTDPAGKVRHYGPILTDNESGSAGKVPRTSWASIDLVGWRLRKRFHGKKAATTDPDVTHTNVDSGLIVENVLAALNAEAATGITMGTRGTFVARTISYAWKRALDLLGELAAIDGSFEWRSRYVDGKPPTVYLDLLETIGQNREDVYFEYGTGKKNCVAYSILRDANDLATDLYATGSGALATASDAAARAVYGRTEELITPSDVSVSSLLGALATAHLAVRKQPRRTLTLTLGRTSRTPAYGVEWDYGDVVNARVEAMGKPRVDGFIRVWNVEVGFSDDGVETITPTLVES